MLEQAARRRPSVCRGSIPVSVLPRRESSRGGKANALMYVGSCVAAFRQVGVSFRELFLAMMLLGGELFFFFFVVVVVLWSCLVLGVLFCSILGFHLVTTSSLGVGVYVFCVCCLLEAAGNVLVVSGMILALDDGRRACREDGRRGGTGWGGGRSGVPRVGCVTL